MKKLTSILVLSAALSAPTFADNDHHKKENTSSGKMEEMQNQGMMMNMMSHEQMMAMHNHMGKMQDLMMRIQAEKDPKEHKKLMSQHMDMMQKGMEMMESKNGGMNKGNMMKEQGMRSDKGVPDMDPKMCMENMHERMNMMQMMMGQMMKHQMEDKDVK